MGLLIRKQKKITKPTFKILIGLPGSGKTTYAKQFLNDKDSVYLSSDEIRVELSGFEDQTKNEEVFKIMNERAFSALGKKKNVIYDATNISRKRRVHLISEIKKKAEVFIDAYLFCMPISLILENNIVRTERTLPFDTVIRYLKTMDVPMYYEGYNNIYLVNNELRNNTYGIEDFLNKVSYYNQGNPYHSETLGKHTRTVVSSIMENTGKILGMDLWILTKAAYYHDYGKIYTREFNDKKGYYTYYNHEKISAYIWLCYVVQHNIADKERKYRLSDSNYQVAALIAHHMDFYKANIENTKNLLKDEDLFKMLLMLHDADEKREENIL